MGPNGAPVKAEQPGRGGYLGLHNGIEGQVRLHRDFARYTRYVVGEGQQPQHGCTNGDQRSSLLGDDPADFITDRVHGLVTDSSYLANVSALSLQ